MKQAIQAVTGNLKPGKYQDAIRTLNPVVPGQELSPEPKQAVAGPVKFGSPVSDRIDLLPA